MKHLWLSFFVFFLLPLAVVAAGNLNASIDQTTAAINNVDGSATFHLLLNLSARAPSDVAITGVEYLGFANEKDSLAQTVFSYSVEKTILSPGDSNIELNITIDLSQDTSLIYAGDYPGTFNITTNSFGDYAALPVTIQVTDENPNASLGSVSLSIVQGNSQSQTIQYQNIGNTDFHNIVLSVSDLSDGTNTLSASAVSFTPQTIAEVNFSQIANVVVSVAVPANQPVGTYTGTITAISDETTVTAPITVTVVAQTTALAVNNATITAGPSQSFSQNIVVKNTGTVDLENLQVELTAVTGYNLAVSPTRFNLSAGQSRTLTFTGTIPEDSYTDETKTTTLRVFNGDVDESAPITLITQSMLELRDVTFETDDEDQNIDNGERFRKLKPGDTLTISGTVKNLYSRSEDITIENIEVEIKIKDIDDGDDMKETVDLNDLDATEDDDFSIEFAVPYTIKDGDSFDVILTVTGEDQNGGEHTVEWDLTLEVDRESHNIKITKAQFTRPIISCIRTTNLEVELMNIGARDEDEVTLTIDNNDLNIAVREMNIQLDSNPKQDDNTYDYILPMTFSENVAPGTYLLRVRAYYNNDELSDSVTVPLEVKVCSSTTTTQQTTTTRQTVTTMPVTTTTFTLAPSQQPEDLESYEGEIVFKNSGNDTMIITLLIISIVLGVLLIGILAYIAFMKK